MNAADTSVAVAAALPWHEAHRAARGALARPKTRLISQVGFEAYSVLTRLPPPRRVPARVAWQYLREAFVLPPLSLEPAEYVELLEVAATEGVVGGAVYDALVAATAKQATATLLTLDRRAVTVYQLVGADYRLIG